MAGAKPKRGRAVELRILPIAHQFPRLPIPTEIRLHVRAALPAGSAHKPCLDIEQPDIIRAGIAAAKKPMPQKRTR